MEEPMRVAVTWIVAVAVGAAAWMPQPGSVAAESPEVSVTVLPGRYANVRGDRAKFRAHHWMSDGYVAGLSDLTVHHTMPDGTVFESEARALPGDNDWAADASLTKEGLGFVSFDFQEFRKWFDQNGGVYYPFTAYDTAETNKELALDIGRFDLKSGLTLEGWPELEFGYEREYKDGAKSRLTWTGVKEGTTTRRIGPSWQDVEEIVDVFDVQASHEIAGFALKGEQRWELVRSELFREERSLATTGVGTDTNIRRQDQTPESSLMTTLLSGERQLLGEKAFVASAYRFAHMDNREMESLLTTTELGLPINDSHTRVNARADNDFDSHTWAGTFSASPWPEWGFSTKLKSEIIKREGNSTYPTDADIDGLIDRVDASLNNSKAVRWGEGASVRFTGIPRTALYTELELEQGRVLLREDRVSLDGPDAGNGASSGETFNRETVTDVRRGALTFGGRFDPTPIIDVTAQARRRVNNSDYDDQRESLAASGALSAFMDEQNVHTNEFITRLTVKPCRWFRSSLRYQFRADEFSTRFEAQDTSKADMRSHVYTYDVTLQPFDPLVTTASFSRQTAATSTPASLSATTSNTPTFNADVNTFMLSADYTPKPEVTLTQSLLYSQADNFNDFTSFGMPYGTDFNRLDLATGVTWAFADDTSLKTTYELYTYSPSSLVEIGGYHAHVLWLELSKEF
jgi:hypothetical protein